MCLFLPRMEEARRGIEKLLCERHRDHRWHGAKRKQIKPHRLTLHKQPKRNDHKIPCSLCPPAASHKPAVPKAKHRYLWFSHKAKRSGESRSGQSPSRNGPPRPRLASLTMAKGVRCCPGYSPVLWLAGYSRRGPAWRWGCCRGAPRPASTCPEVGRRGSGRRVDEPGGSEMGQQVCVMVTTRPQAPSAAALPRHPNTFSSPSSPCPPPALVLALRSCFSADPPL